MALEKIYLETNIFNKAHRCGLSGKMLSSLLKKHSLSPAVGIHTIYEMAKAFININGFQTGSALFSILRDLEPYYQALPEVLYNQEILKLRKGTTVYPLLDPINLAATEQEVERLAQGLCDEKARKFIVDREMAIRENHPKFALTYIEETKIAFNQDQTLKRRLRTFEDVYSELEDQLPEIIYKFLNNEQQIKVTLSEAQELYYKIDLFPAIRSTLRSYVYLCFICIKHNSIPGIDKINDYRHVIEASYCSIFGTDDIQLSKTVPRINQDLEVLNWKDLLKLN